MLKKLKDKSHKSPRLTKIAARRPRCSASARARGSSCQIILPMTEISEMARLGCEKKGDGLCIDHGEHIKCCWKIQAVGQLERLGSDQIYSVFIYEHRIDYSNSKLERHGHATNLSHTVTVARPLSILLFVFDSYQRNVQFEG